MKSTLLPLISATLLSLCSVTIAVPELIIDIDSAVAVARRALPNAPDGYTPKGETCPDNRPVVRSAATLSSNETSWLEKRRNNTIQPMKDLLSRANITGFDASSYIDQHSGNASTLPNIAIAVSGGGYRALMNGGGALQAFDSRTENSTAAGHLGGLLQSSTYLAGLSGGGWLVGSIYLNNFTTVTALRDEPSGSVWEFGNSVIEGPEKSGVQILNTAEYYVNLEDAVSGKADAGFNTTITDYWGRALSFQLIDATNGGESYTWSSIALGQNFQNGEIPMPVLVADGRAPGEQLISGNATVYEFNPWEFGTFDPTTFGFVPLEFLGSAFDAGVLPDNEECVRGFDNAGFVMGTSSSLFNQFILNINQTSLPSFLKNAISDILTDIGRDNDDIAAYQPNPFFHYNDDTSESANSTALTLVDGGEDLQNIPLHPLIQPERHVDVIFAVDSSADTSNWPNGTALVATYERSLNSSGIGNGTAFPSIPDQNTFVNLGLNRHPTFFGCDASNITGPAPLVVYIPNFPYITNSNVSTFDLSYNTTQRNSIIENGYDTATLGNATTDSQWPTCVGCAILSRSFDKTGTDVPDVCKSCFSKYCWDGTRNSTTPAPYQPSLALGEEKITSAAGISSLPSKMAPFVAFGAAVIFLF